MPRDLHVAVGEILRSGKDYVQFLTDAGPSNLCKHGVRQLYCSVCRKHVCAQWTTVRLHCTQCAKHIEAVAEKEGRAWTPCSTST